MSDPGDPGIRRTGAAALAATTPLEQQIRTRIGRAVSRARLALAWESLWPRLLPLLGVAALFLAVSWFGLWRVLPEIARYAVLALFGLAALVALVPPARLRLADRATALARVERATGAPHRPATDFSDRLALDETDPGTRALWAAHRERLLANFARLKAGTPSPGVPRRDPLAFRFLAVLILGVAFLFAGPERYDRVAEAFLGPPATPVTTVAARVDAWATPPQYTGRAPVFLTGDSLRDKGAPVAVPAGTTVVVRISGGTDNLTVWSEGAAGEAEVAAEPATARAPAADGAPPVEHKLVLDRSGGVAVRRGEDKVLAWNFDVIPDNPPTIQLSEQPSRANSGATQLSYKVGDDYGVVSAEAHIRRADEESAGGRPLVQAPDFPLAMPRLRMREGEGQTIKDLTSHPWAGAHVWLSLSAKDELGQIGESVPADFILPARVFTNPVAKALVEQRRVLALDATKAPEVANALDLITIAPEKFLPDTGAYLAIRSAYYRTIHARGDEDLVSVVDYLWEIALGLEDGNLSTAANDLRNAEEALRQALQRNASPEEIQQLMDQLRQAMQQYMQAMSEQSQSNQEQSSQSDPGGMQEIRPNQLEQMMQQMQQLAENGSFDAAQELLNQLQNMMENMQAGQMQRQQQQQGQGPMGEALEQLGQMIQRQQQLMDQTFSFNQDGQPGMGSMTEQQAEQVMRNQHEGDPGQDATQLNRGRTMTEEQIQEALRQFREGRQQRGEQLGQLQQGQNELQQSLQALMDQMRQQGLDPQEGMGNAEQSMGEALRQLQNGQPTQAMDPQQQALEQLRGAAQSMAEQLAQQMGQQQGPEGTRQSQNSGREDPLGRQMRNRGEDFGTRVKVPDEIDVQRAREILETIRRRLDDMTRPVIERNYLERLLDLY